MIISRLLTTARAGKFAVQNSAKFHVSSAHNSGHHWYYRGGAPKNPKYSIVLAEFIQGVAWWWVLWHLFTEYEHVTGEFEYPDPSKWTDEELGIPDNI